MDASIMSQCHFYALRNNHLKMVIPGPNNFFDGHQYTNVMIGRGEFLNILPIPQGMSVADLIAKYSNDLYELKVRRVDKSDLFIRVEKLNGYFDVSISTGVTPISTVNILFFHMTLTETKELLSLNPTFLNEQYKSIIEEYLNENPQDCPRRNVVLLSDAFINNCFIRCQFFCYFLNGDDSGLTKYFYENEKTILSSLSSPYDELNDDVSVNGNFSSFVKIEFENVKMKF